MMKSRTASKESVYNSAPSSDNELSEVDDENSLRRPQFLNGSSESSLIDDTSRKYHLSLLPTSFSEKFNINALYRVLSRRKDINLAEDDEPENDINVRILGFEIIERERRFTVYKLKVERQGHWGVELIPHWHLYRRYNDFVKLDEQLRKDFPNLDLNLPAKKWVGDNFEPVFLGKRMSALSKYLQGIMRHPQVADCASVSRFLCLNKPPHRACSISSSRALYDCFEETIKELRLQLRRKETLENLNDNLKEALNLRDAEVETFKTENEHLKKQKDALMRAFGNEGSGSNPIFPVFMSDTHSSTSEVKSVSDN